LRYVSTCNCTAFCYQRHFIINNFQYNSTGYEIEPEWKPLFIAHPTCKCFFLTTRRPRQSSRSNSTPHLALFHSFSYWARWLLFLRRDVI
jgi:hypothetical protein